MSPTAWYATTSCATTVTIFLAVWSIHAPVQGTKFTNNTIVAPDLANGIGIYGGAAGYTFDPATGNTVTVTFGASSQRYVRLTFTANTGWPAGQLSEFEVYAS
jgi:hypothetical protein